jgi:hypothetical protein
MFDTPSSSPVDNPISSWMVQDALSSDEAAVKLISGLVNVSNHLLAKLEKATGVGSMEVLRDLALREY